MGFADIVRVIPEPRTKSASFYVGWTAPHGNLGSIHAVAKCVCACPLTLRVGASVHVAVVAVFGGFLIAVAELP